MNMIPPHPLIGDLNDLTEEQLQSKISELYRKLGTARAMNNAHLAHQVLLALTSYQAAYTAKMKNNPGNNFDSSISIS